jgi:hypothetical protein
MKTRTVQIGVVLHDTVFGDLDANADVRVDDDGDCDIERVLAFPIDNRQTAEVEIANLTDEQIDSIEERAREAAHEQEQAEAEAAIERAEYEAECKADEARDLAAERRYEARHG